MYYWYHPPEFWDFYAFTQTVNLQIVREFEKEGIEFAFPTSTNYLTQADGQPLHINLANDRQLNRKLDPDVATLGSHME
jgi:MscS family membrane protein